MIKVVVWDLGGVLITDPADNFWQNKEGTKELRRDFGSNKLSTEKFVSRGSKLLGINSDDFLHSYKKIYFSVKPVKEVLKIYEDMKTDKYVLSDTNPLQMNCLIKQNYFGILDNSKKNYFSPELGMRKDSKKIFEYLIEDLKLSPQEILFIDNKEKIVELAKSVGLNAIQFVAVKKLKNDLKKFDIK